MDKISVIIPIYNVSKYIFQCLDSVINQSYKNLEIICVDDCGNDNSMEIVEKYALKDNRIKILHNSCNKGLAESRNIGMEYSTGKFIFFLDSDDYLKLDIIEKLHSKICSVDADMVISGVEAFPDNQNDIMLNKKANKAKIYYPEIDDFGITQDNFFQVYNKVFCMAWGKLYSSEFLKRNNILFIRDNMTYEDNGFNIKILSNLPKIASISDVGVMYRIRSSSISYVMDKKKNKLTKDKHFNAVLDDAFCYINSNFSKEKAEKLYENFKNSDIFPNYFKRRFDFLFNIKWSKFNKRIEILSIPLFREKIQNDKIVTKILGITVKS